MLNLQKEKSRYWQAFLLCLLVSAALFLPHCIVDAINGGFFHYAGDFNDQQISFYAYANQFIKAGGSFSWATDLGSGFVNSYSFYLVGSPFFWLSMLFPAKAVPWLMVPLLCLKFALAGGGAYLWARRWTKTGIWAVVAGCLYAFSGFGLYNIFFNHFLDVMALFPYLLAALDAAVLEDKRGALPFLMAISLLNNYFFFAGQAVFLILYFVCMCVGKKYKITRPLFGRLAFETLLGCAMGCILLVPAALSLLQNPRTIDPFDGYGYLLYGSSQQYAAILYSAFLMPGAPYMNNMFDSGILKWTSLTAYLPVVGIAGGLAFCRARRRHPFSRLLKISILFALIPVLNSAFYAFNSSFYARWYYMPLLVLCAATVISLESVPITEHELPRSLGLVALITLTSIAFAVVPHTGSDGTTTIGVVGNQLYFWAILAVSMMGLGLFALLLRQRRHSPQGFPALMLAAVLGFSLVYGTVHLSITKYGQWDTDSGYVQQTYGEAEEVKALLPQGDFYRVDAYKCYNNMGLWLDQSCIQFFNSTVAPHILEFYPTVGVTRDVNSKPEAALYALRGLLGVRYTLVPTAKAAEWEEENLEGWTPALHSTSYTIYENDNYVPMGLVYDHYVIPDTFEKTPETQRGNLLMKALLLTEEQIEEYGNLLTPLDEEDAAARDYAHYQQDCDARRAAAATHFTATNTGFTAEITLEKENLVLFSVPYDDGFTATVNGAAAGIIKVDNGLMAVKAPAGENEISFTYRTPGLRLGLGISGCAAVLYVFYLLFLFVTKPKKEEIKNEPTR